MTHSATRAVMHSLILAGAFIAASCQSPLNGYDAEQVRREVILSARRGASDPAAAPTTAGVSRAVELDPNVSMPELAENVDPGKGLDGDLSQAVPISLGHTIRSALKANLDLQVARLVPEIRAEQITEAQAQFDPSVFAEYTFHETDVPLQGSSIGGIPTSATAQSRTEQDASVGVTKRLQTGGEVTLSTGIQHVDDDSPNLTLTPDPGTTSNLTFSLRQPLLRNAGVRVNRARIELARNAHDREILALRAELLDVLARVESAYWELLFAWQQVAVRQRTLDMTLDTQRELKAREGVDVSPLQLAQAASFVEQRQSDLIDARRALRDASDRLKNLIHDQQLPLAGEAIIRPTDLPTEQPLTMNLTQALTTGLRRRPEIGQAALNVNDAAIRVEVADNQKLPSLEIQAELKLYSLADRVDNSYRELSDREFFDYLVGGRFEYPIGNRAAEATSRRERLSRQAQTLALQRTSRQVVLTVKQSMRAAQSAREKIRTTRAARIASAENLRTLEERERTGEALTPEFILDLKLTTQQRLAESELREIAAVADYNAARARFFAAVGTLLDQRNVDLQRLDRTRSDTPDSDR